MRSPQTFTLPDHPELRLTGCSALTRQRASIAYRFADTHRVLWLVSALLAEGSPIAIAWTPGQPPHRLLRDKRLGDEVLEEIGQELKALEAQACTPGRVGAASAKTWILSGDINFAHHLWNEAPALAALARHLGPACAHIHLQLRFRTLSALFSLYALFHEVEAPATRPGPAQYLTDKLLVRPGAKRVSRELRKHLLAGLPSLEHSWLQFVQAHSPRVWITLREDKRVCHNLVPLLSTFMDKCLERFPRAGFVLDGLSYPDDYDCNPHYENVRPILDGRYAQTEQAIQALIAQRPRALPATALCSTNGLPLSQAMRIAGEMDFYIAHAGSLQHKIGWAHAVPGFIHSPPSPNQASAAQWHGDMVEGGLVPHALNSDEVVQDLADSTAKPRNRSYRFSDIEALSQRLVALLGDHLRA